ncbi:hypothetical protein DBT_0122 [Dissulfuribacter thermophilus]|uniref:General secretion pathway protein I n=2 Tax=Dissulfuribacter thermophilus TaxID=1156395 RepID=A0A1B9F903_9BACT|nr:hypothetical protein DBT_0122 [Dissulfuribacter thermophilus]
MKVRNKIEKQMPSEGLSQKGFTLMEVLVATAICGIALGIALSGLSQGHQSNMRAVLMEEAGRAARLVMHKTSSLNQESSKEEMEGEIEGMEGWSYSVNYDDLNVRIKDTSSVDQEEEEKVFEIDELKKMTIKIFSPKGRIFTIVSWR